jgi:hypothetical protein
LRVCVQYHQGAQLTAAGWRAVRVARAPCGFYPPTRRGEAHPPRIEGSAECEHLHQHGRTEALTHGELVSTGARW